MSPFYKDLILDSEDILKEIFGIFEPLDIFRLATVSKKWHKVSKDKMLWKSWARRNQKRGTFLLFFSINKGWTEYVELVIKSGICLNESFKYRHRNYQPLEFALETNQREIALLLVNSDAALCCRKTITSCTYLIWNAVCKGYHEVVDAMIQHGSNPGVEVRLFSMEGWSQSLLYKAAERGDLATVKVLVNRKAKLEFGANQYFKIADFYSYYHVSPLYIAAKNGHVEVVKFLIASGANIFFNTPVQKINFFNDQPFYVTSSVLNIAQENKHFKIVSILKCEIFLRNAIETLRLENFPNEQLLIKLENNLRAAKNSDEEYFKEYFQKVLRGEDPHSVTSLEMEFIYKLKPLSFLIREKTTTSIFFFQNKENFYLQFNQEPRFQLTVENDCYLSNGL